MSGVIYWLDMAGVIVFALSGVILACRSRMDPFGMLVLAAVTGIGGGTLRDLVLGVRPVFWVTDPTYLWVILATVGVSLVGFHYIHRLSRGVLPIADAFGLALFTVIGTHKALLLGTSGVVAVLMGMMTGVAGGIVYVALQALDAPLTFAIAASLSVTLGLRLAAIHWHLALPVFAWVTVPPKYQDANAPLSTPQKAKERVRMIRRERTRR